MVATRSSWEKDTRDLIEGGEDPDELVDFINIVESEMADVDEPGEDNANEQEGEFDDDDFEEEDEPDDTLP